MIAYVVTNLANGRQYIGVTKQPLHRRWAAHLRAAARGARTVLHAAIRKHGVGKFSVSPLASPLGDLAALEVLLIAQFETRAPAGYNLTAGGDGVRGLDRAIVLRTAQKNRGRHHTAEAKALIGAGGRGRQVSADTRAAIGEAHRGRPLTTEHRAKLSAAKLGRSMPPRTPEHQARIAEGLRRAHARKRVAL